MDCSFPDHRRTRPRSRTLCRFAWLASLAVHGLAAVAAWAVTAPVRYEPSELIGQSTQIELMATMARWEFQLPQPAPAETTLPVRIMPAKAEIARRQFRVESTSVSEPTPFELALVERILARPPSPKQRTRERSEPVFERRAAGLTARQPSTPPLPSQPGTADRPLPELIQSPPPTYPQTAIERRWEGTVLLRLHVTAEGHVGQIAILDSSGYDVLDGAAVHAVRAWRFVPAIRDGRPVASSVRLPVRFELSAAWSPSFSTLR